MLLAVQGSQGDRPSPVVLNDTPAEHVDLQRVFAVAAQPS